MVFADDENVVDWSSPVRVKREPPPSLDEGRKTAPGRRPVGGSKLAAHGLWQTTTSTKKKQQQPHSKSLKKSHSKRHGVKKPMAVKIADDEDMLADGSGSGDGPAFQPLAPPSQGPPPTDTRSENLVD